MSQIAFYQPHLDRVSRSFAFCISRLEGELREWVSLSYLLCRLLDTVEDAPWSEPERQEESFRQFESFLRVMPSREGVAFWVGGFGEVDPGERLLLQDAYRCFENFHALRPEVKDKIRGPVLNMESGMRRFLRERREQGALRLRTLAEVNQYCFFVAGLVGELLTDLVAQRWPSLSINARTYLDAHHFGLFLQKINLLKDQSKDEKEGRFLVPSRKELLASLAKDAEGALRYLQFLPVAEKGFRLFCAWSLFLGLASLPWIERSRLLGIFSKIPRVVTEGLLKRVEGLIDDNGALAGLFRDMLPKFPSVKTPVTEPVKIAWMQESYSGRLRDGDFRELGLCS